MIRKYRCLYNGSYAGDKMNRLTVNKDYDAILTHSHFGDSIDIIDDLQDPASYYVSLGTSIWFKDVTAEYRNKTIDEILT